MQTAAPAAPVNILSTDLSSDANRISATPLPHPAVVPEYNNISDKLFGDLIDLIVNANNDPRTTTLKTVPVPPPEAAPSLVATAEDEHAGEDVKLEVSNTKTNEIRLVMNI